MAWTSSGKYQHDVRARDDGNSRTTWICKMDAVTSYGTSFQYKSPNSYEQSVRMLCRTFTTTVEPTLEPITLEQLKDRLRIGSTCDFDAELSAILTTARKQVESDTYRRLVNQTIVGRLDGFLSVREIELRVAPVSSITSITYVDQNGTTQTLSTSVYGADLLSTPPRIILKTSQSWLDTEPNTANSVAITFVAGYGATAASVPAQAKLAIVEYAKVLWGGCEGSEANYNRLISGLQWTAFHKVY